MDFNQKIKNYFKSHPKAKSVIIASDGNCFQPDGFGKNCAKNHAKENDLKFEEVKRGQKVTISMKSDDVIKPIIGATEVKTLKSEVKTLKTDKTNLGAEVKTLKSEIKTLKTDKTNLGKEVKALTSEIKSMKTLNANLESELAQLKKEEPVLDADSKADADSKTDKVTTDPKEG